MEIPAWTLVPLIRHRWADVGPVGRESWICTPGVPTLCKTFDPVCYGCKSEIPWVLIPNVERYLGSSNSQELAERLALRLDLRFCELKLQAARCGVRNELEAEEAPNAS